MESTNGAEIGEVAQTAQLPMYASGQGEIGEEMTMKYTFGDEKGKLVMTVGQLDQGMKDDEMNNPWTGISPALITILGQNKLKRVKLTVGLHKPFNILARTAVRGGSVAAVFTIVEANPELDPRSGEANR